MQHMFVNALPPLSRWLHQSYRLCQDFIYFNNQNCRPEVAWRSMLLIVDLTRHQQRLDKAIHRFFKFPALQGH